jgi:peptidoglycan/xylan/chitin deacetylase (PgdA/CDA1 family)
MTAPTRSGPGRRAFEKEEQLPKEIMAAFGVDIDAVGGWLGSYGGEDSPSDIQRGVFAGQVGTPRVLDLFKKHDIPASWFIPGHSIETFPESVKLIVDAGHEIGAHGYSHENPIAMSPKQEEDVLVKSIELIEQVTGQPPQGYVAPWWEMSAVTAELLLKYGFRYDHSQSYDDFSPFYSRVGDQWTKIDYTQDAASWMKPLIHGREIDLVEIGANWYLDDLPPMMFIKKSPNSHGFVSPRHLEEMWRDQFDWVYANMDYAVFAMTIHPDVSGRPQVLLMLDRLIRYISEHDGVKWMTMADIAADFRDRRPFAG